MANINFNVPNEKLSRIIAAMGGLYLIPTDAEGDPLYTAAEWAKEAVRRRVIRDVLRWERKVASIAATETIVPDDELLS